MPRRPGGSVCAGSCGPGNLHLINGLYDCHRNHQPVLAIAAHIPSTEIAGYFQETHPRELFRECSHFAERDERVAVPARARRAMRTAIDERGVAVIVLPGDIALGDGPDEAPAWSESSPPSILPADADLDRLAALLNASDAVTLLCGSGTQGRARRGGRAGRHARRAGRACAARQAVRRMG